MKIVCVSVRRCHGNAVKEFCAFWDNIYDAVCVIFVLYPSARGGREEESICSSRNQNLGILQCQHFYISKNLLLMKEKFKVILTIAINVIYISVTA